LLILLPLGVIVTSAANIHFSSAASVAAHRQKLVRIHEDRLSFYAGKLHSLEPRLSRNSRVFLHTLQTIIGRAASVCERVAAPLNWSLGDELTGTVALALIVMGIISLIFGPVVGFTVLILMIFGWHSTPMLYVRHTVASTLNYIAIMEGLQRESQLIRMLALRSHPETVVTQQL